FVAFHFLGHGGAEGVSELHCWHGVVVGCQFRGAGGRGLNGWLTDVDGDDLVFAEESDAGFRLCDDNHVFAERQLLPLRDLITVAAGKDNVEGYEWFGAAAALEFFLKI